MKKVLFILLLISLWFKQDIYAQKLGIKTNLLYWATTTPNLGMEAALAPNLTLSITGSYNPLTFGSSESNKKIQHWMVRPELRFWPYEKWDGHFLGVQGLFTSYNAGGINIPVIPLDNLKDYRYEGYGAGIGFSYGYQWILAPHWNLELTAGMGYMYFNYECYECRQCGDFIEKTHKHWFGPMNLGITLIYLFKSKKD